MGFSFRKSVRRVTGGLRDLAKPSTLKTFATNPKPHTVTNTSVGKMATNPFGWSSIENFNNPKDPSGSGSGWMDEGGGGGFGSFHIDPWPGKTSVELTADQLVAIQLAADMISGKYGNFKQVMSGRPDYGLLQQGVIGPLQEQYRTQILPSIATTYSGGPYGSSYWSGARQEAQRASLSEMGNTTANVRLQAQQNATGNMLNAAQGAFPALTEVVSIPHTNEEQNLNRAIDVWYKNQGLALQAETNMAASMAQQAQLNFQKSQYAQYLADQESAADTTARSSKYGMIGGIAGGIIGAYATKSPQGAMAGYQIGSGLGQYYGGSRNSGSTTMGSGVGNGLASYQQYQQNQRNSSLNNSGYGQYNTDANTLPAGSYWNTKTQRYE